MRPRLAQFLASPQFPDDPERTRRAGLFHLCYVYSVAWLIAIVAGNLLGGRIGWAFNAAILFVVLLSVGPYLLVRRGYLGLGAFLWLVLAFVSLTALVAKLGTIRAPSLGYYLVLVICAGLVFGGRALIVMVGLSAAAVAALINAQNAGWLPLPDYRVGVTQWVTATAFFAAVGGLTHAVTRQIRDSLARAELEVAERRRAEEKLREINHQLEDALHNVKTLKGLLPICAWCRKVREDEGYWSALESYVSAHTSTTFTHGICPDCQAKHFPSCRRVT